MEYAIAGILATVAMVLYRQPIAASSPLSVAQFPSVWLETRQRASKRTIAGAVGVLTSFGVLWVVAGARRGPGTDYWARYVPIFNDVSSGWDVDIDVGFLMINRFVAAFTHESQWLFALMALATIALTYRFIVRMSVNPALSVFVFVFGGFYLESFNLMRQCLAIAILLNTIELLVTRRLVPFLLLTLLAFSLHASALIWLLTWPLGRLRLGSFGRAATMIAVVMVMLQVPQMLEQQVERWAPVYAWYFGSNYGEARVFDPYGLVIASAVFVASLFALRGLGKKHRYVSTILNLQGVQLVALVAAATLPYAFSRLTYYFTPIQIILVPLILSRVKDPLLRAIATAGTMVLYVIGYYFKFVVWNAHGVFPYASVL